MSGDAKRGWTEGLPHVAKSPSGHPLPSFKIDVDGKSCLGIVR